MREWRRIFVDGLGRDEIDEHISRQRVAELLDG
jgi:hypothetical protein